MAESLEGQYLASFLLLLLTPTSSYVTFQPPFSCLISNVFKLVPLYEMEKEISKRPGKVVSLQSTYNNWCTTEDLLL